MTDREFTVWCCLATFILALVSSWIIKIYDNSKVKKEKKQQIFLLEHSYYAPRKLQDLIYELKTSRLNNFDNNSN